MDPTALRALAARLADGRTVASTGPIPREIPLPRGLVALRVRCGGGDARPLGPWRDLAARAAKLLGEPVDRDDEPSPPGWSPRQRLLGRVPGADRVGELLRRIARLAAAAPRGVALVFDDVDRADEATRLLLDRLLERPGVFPVAIALGFADPSSAEARGLLARVVSSYGKDAVLAPSALPAAPELPAAPRDLQARLDADALLTLRAAAVAGDGFSVADVAALRELSPVRVLEHLQRACDAGVAFEDVGDGTLRWPPGVAAGLRAEVLPSLARTWHRRLAGRAGASASVAVPAPTPAPVPEVRQVPVVADPPVRREAPREGHHLPRVNPALRPEEVFEPPTAARPLTPVPPPAPPAQRVVRPPGSARTDADHVRAAHHLVAVGDLEGAARQLVEASREAASMGLFTQALAQGRDALALLAELPASDGRRRLRAETLLALGTLQWHGSGGGQDFSLAAARSTLAEARGAVKPGDPAALRGAIAAAIAGVAGDLGDVTALDEALQELSETTRSLMAEGATLEAARLLNDQAALLLRAGDPVRGAWLIQQAREVFEARVESMDAAALAADPSALAELAETDHLYARLPLHAPARAGRGDDAMALGREHGLAALELYQRIGDSREAAGVLVTLGHVELRAGHLEHARKRLVEAMRLQESIGDVLGIARSSGALAEVEAASGRFDEAVRRLGDSVTFNVDKGSALGVAFARAAFARVAAAAKATGDAAAAEALAGFEAELARAEELVGRARLPSDVA